MFRLVLFIFLLSCSLGSSAQKTFEVSGNIKMLIGNRFKIPSEAILIELRPGNYVQETDSLGFFKFPKVKKGKYNLVVIGTAADQNKFPITVKNQSIKSFDVLLQIKECLFTKETAEKDIKNNYIRLLLIGGIAPVYFVGQEKHEKKYNFTYHEFGCVPESLECIIEYNNTIFEYFDKKYGIKWRGEVRQDIEGLKKQK